MNCQLPMFLAAALVYPSYAAGPATISLPRPNKAGRVSVEAALAARRSIRSYAKQPLTLADISQLLWAAQGITSPEGKRTAASAMHRYPLEIAVVAQDVDGLPCGAYHYMPATHSLELLRAAKPGTRLLENATSQGQVHSAPAVFVIAAVYERMGFGRAESHLDRLRSRAGQRKFDAPGGGAGLRVRRDGRHRYGSGQRRREIIRQ